MSESKVVPLHPPELKKTSEEKWGRGVMKLGFSIVPSLILRAQRRLGLSPTQLAVLLQLLDYWWDVDRKPYPGKKALSERLSLSPRQVQRYIAELEAANLVQRVERYSGHGGRTTNTYDLSGLVEKLNQLEPEFRELEAQVKEKRRQISRSGGLRKKHNK